MNVHGDPKTEYPFYLGHADEVGAGDGLGFNLNLPLPAGTTVATWFSAIEEATRRIRACEVGALVVSLGLDTFVDDPISKFSLRSEDFLELGSQLEKLGVPTALVLEGGYAARELGINAANVLDGFEQSSQR